jgi:predicted signal transduction protein with EAL and GGDEF domain
MSVATKLWSIFIRSKGNSLDKEVAFAMVESLKNYGVRISLDDFGTAYASLSQLPIGGTLT